MATVRNFKVTKTTNMTTQPTLRKNKRAAKPTHMSRHTIAAHLFLPQRPMPTHHPKNPAVQRLIIFISEMVLGKRLASRQKNLQPDGLG